MDSWQTDRRTDTQTLSETEAVSGTAAAAAGDCKICRGQKGKWKALAGRLSPR